jgi:hypothetical protein
MRILALLFLYAALAGLVFNRLGIAAIFVVPGIATAGAVRYQGR